MLSLSPLAAIHSRRRTAKPMLKIGVFAQVSRVSIKMLRHYDEMGLLKPVFVDDFRFFRTFGEKNALLLQNRSSICQRG